jgi:glutathione S-transferase
LTHAELQGMTMPELTLFASPRACSLACHIALEESGLPYVAKIIRIREGEHQTSEYLEINPWGKFRRYKLTPKY